MSILVVGLSHRTCPVDVREQLAFSRDGAATALMLFRNRYPDCEAALLSTCNRVEMIVVADGAHPDADDVVGFLAVARDLPVQAFRQYLYELTDEQAIRHLFRLAGGLESMVVGEYQIVNQLKSTYAMASEQGTTGRLLNRLFHHAFAVGKRLRTETEICSRKVSVPSVAVDVARCIFSDFSRKSVLVVGAGDMAQLVCQYLRQAKVERFVVTSRTLANARALANACDGVAVPYDQLETQLDQADIVITATACPKVIFTTERVQAVQKRRGHRPLFFLDLAVPRDVDPGIEKLQEVYLYDVDALGRVVAENQEHRQGQTEACERILDEEMAAFETWLNENRAGPMIRQMFDDAHDLCEAELVRLFEACPDLTKPQQEAVAQLADRLINKLMHPCVQTMRRHSLSASSTTLADALHRVATRHRVGRTQA